MQSEKSPVTPLITQGGRRITAVGYAEVLLDETVFAQVQFDDKTEPDGTPVYSPVLLSDTNDWDIPLLTEIKSHYGDKWVVPDSVLALAKRRKHTEINAWRDEQENGSLIFELAGHRWDCGKASQSRLAPVITVAKAGVLPDGFFWTDADNQDVPMTTEALIELETEMQKQMVLQGFKIHERQRQMKVEVDSLSDYDEIRHYPVGWLSENGY